MEPSTARRNGAQRSRRITPARSTRVARLFPIASLAAMKILSDVCSIPTAPFAEQHVVRYVERFVAARKKLRLTRDEHGNLLIELALRVRIAQPRWVFAAHMDHPGFVATRM